MATEGEGAQSGAEGTQSGTGENTTGTNSGTDSNSSDSGTQSGTETISADEAKRLVAEAESLRSRMKAADQRAAKTEADLKQLRDKDLPDQEKLARDYQESIKQVETLQQVNNELALSVAFLSDNTYSWHNPKRALQILDKTQVEIAADGSVSGLKDALKALAASDPYLIKQEAATEEQKPPATAPGNNGASAASKASTKSLTSRFPAMATRVRKS